MIANGLVFLVLSFQEFCLGSLESVLVCVFLNLMYRLVYYQRKMEENEDEHLHQCEGPDLDLTELPDCYAFTDQQKTSRIRDLEHEVEVLNHQLVHTRNQLNTLLTETDRYKRVHGQVSWLLEQFRHTLTGVYDKPKLEAILPPLPPLPPPPPLPLEDRPLPPPPPPLSTTDSTGDSCKAVSTIDLTTSETSQLLSVSGGENEMGENEVWESVKGGSEVGESVEEESEMGESLEGESEEGGYSDDWETTEEVTATESTPSVGEQSSSPPGPDLAILLANVNPRTHISEIFRKLNSQ